MSRMDDLKRRRRALLVRCEEQRVELSQRVTQLPKMLRLPFVGARSDGGVSGQRHPLAWMAALAGLMFFGRTRELLSLIVSARTLFSLAARATQVLGVIEALRGWRSGKRAKVRARTQSAAESAAD
jgi:hypothetical protein